jgi:hypothetical protein
MSKIFELSFDFSNLIQIEPFLNRWKPLLHNMIFMLGFMAKILIITKTGQKCH